MTNHFLTTLMNLADTGDTSEHISIGVGRQSFNGVMADVYQLLFPNPNNRDEVKFLAYCYLQLLRASGFEHYLVEKDSRITYQLDRDFDFFYSHTFDLSAVLARLTNRKSAVDRMFHDMPVDDLTPMNLWSRHANPVMRIVGVVVGFVQRAS